MTGDPPDSKGSANKDLEANGEEDIEDSLEEDSLEEDSLEEDSLEEDSNEEISLPDPNIKDSDGSVTYGNETSTAKRTKDWGVEYEHPLDRFHAAPKPRKLGFSGCLFLGIALFILGTVLLGVVLGWVTTGRFVQQGYEVVRLTGKENFITKSPEVPTCYLGKAIDIRIPKCSQPIAVIGNKVTVRGDFLDDVSLTAFRLVVTEQARFAKDLEIYAGEFRDESATLLGTRSGVTLREIIPSQNPEPTTP